jgi:uncharacterized membrane protein (UPF0127 family)
MIMLSLAVLAAAPGCSKVRSGPQMETIIIKGETFHLEIAADETTRTRGLMHRQSIPGDGGMLFIFPQPEYQSFWMGYCLFDIDIIYLDAQGRVTATHKMKAQPPKREDETVAEYEQRVRRDSYPSYYPAQFVIELKGGWLDRLNLRVEDKIALDLPRLKAMAR